jgi:hypothetical protein
MEDYHMGELAISHHLKELNLNIGISMGEIIYILILAATLDSLRSATSTI